MNLVYQGEQAHLFISDAWKRIKRGVGAHVQSILVIKLIFDIPFHQRNHFCPQEKHKGPRSKRLAIRVPQVRTTNCNCILLPSPPFFLEKAFAYNVSTRLRLQRNNIWRCMYTGRTTWRRMLKCVGLSFTSQKCYFFVIPTGARTQHKWHYVTCIKKTTTNKIKKTLHGWT